LQYAPTFLSLIFLLYTIAIHLILSYSGFWLLTPDFYPINPQPETCNLQPVFKTYVCFKGQKNISNFSLIPSLFFLFLLFLFNFSGLYFFLKELDQHQGIFNRLTFVMIIHKNILVGGFFGNLFYFRYPFF